MYLLLYVSAHNLVLFGHCTSGRDHCIGMLISVTISIVQVFIVLFLQLPGHRRLLFWATLWWRYLTLTWKGQILLQYLSTVPSRKCENVYMTAYVTVTVRALSKCPRLTVSAHAWMYCFSFCILYCIYLLYIPKSFQMSITLALGTGVGGSEGWRVGGVTAAITSSVGHISIQCKRDFFFKSSFF